MRILALLPGAADARRAAVQARASAEARLLEQAGEQIWLASPDFATGRATRGLSLARTDRSPDHWHKSRSLATEHALAAAVRELRIEVVHVHHWQGLSRSLVLAAARAGVPAVVSLHDAWIACPIGSRVRTVDSAACDATLGAHPCLACAGAAGPRTPWVPMEQEFLLLAERQRDLQRELELARVRWITDAPLAAQLARWLGSPVCAELMLEPQLEVLQAGYRAALAQGAPAVPAEEWFEARMQVEAQRAWDEQHERSVAAQARAALLE